MFNSIFHTIWYEPVYILCGKVTGNHDIGIRKCLASNLIPIGVYDVFVVLQIAGTYGLLTVNEHGNN